MTDLVPKGKATFIIKGKDNRATQQKSKVMKSAIATSLAKARAIAQGEELVDPATAMQMR